MEDLYGEIIVDHSEYPQNIGKIKNADIDEVLENSSCGDKIRVFIKFDDDKIIDAKFEASACAISTASADIAMGILIGKTKKEAKLLAENFRKMLRGEKKADFESELDAFSHISKMPQRIKCAELVWGVINLF